MNSLKIKRLLSTLIAILWGIIILSFSLQEGAQSGELSGSLAQSLYRLLSVLPFFEQFFDFEFFHFFLRKSAHFMIYFIFGLLSFNALRSYMIVTAKHTFRLGLFGTVFAALDETVQWFTPGRAFAITDIMIDTAGFVLGTLLFYGLGRLRS